jgi:hypothetical protein
LHQITENPNSAAPVASQPLDDTKVMRSRGKPK